MAGLQAGQIIGLPPVLNFGTPAMQKRVLPDIFAAKKFISLAISEPHAGSDVQGIQTSAKLSEDGKHWIVSGMKKWITKGVFLPFVRLNGSSDLPRLAPRSGYFSDYFMTAVRTGPKSLSMMLIERDDTVETRKIRTSYSSAAGTAYVFFEGTKVPVENVLGGEGNGLKGASPHRSLASTLSSAR